MISKLRLSDPENVRAAAEFHLDDDADSPDGIE